MTQINLLKRRGKKAMTLDEFKTWLAQLIVDKRGALPDLNDWKKIKETLDSVKVNTTDDLDASGLAGVKLTFDNQVLEDLMYFQNKIWKSLRVPTEYMVETTYNGQDVNLLEANKYDIQEKTEDKLNGDCNGK